jgi:alpha-galactosidase
MRRTTRAIAALLLAAAAVPAVAIATAAPAPALPNGLALTPPMGWNNWNAFRCDINEQLVKQTADIIVSSGLKAVGYEYVNIDDCWMASSRDSAGRLVPDPVKFPNGITAVADYVHGKGLKLGIYENAGTHTCMGYPGSLGHEQTDANSFASWKVDYLKYDRCNNLGQPWQDQFRAMRDALAATGRPIVFSLCDGHATDMANYAADIGNLWRTSEDINASYSSMLYNYNTNVRLAQYAKPGAWNDPDMLEVGNGMSFTEDRSHFSLWATMAAPLITGADLRSISTASMSILLNSDVIAVDQDRLGRQGTRVSSSGGLDVLAKPLANGDVAVTLFNQNSSTATISTTASAVGIARAYSYRLTNLWSKVVMSTTGNISAAVPGHGVVMYRLAAGTGSSVGSTTRLISPSSQRCLDVYNSETAPGTKVEIWDCHSGANQRWTTTAAGELQVYSGTRCLHVRNNGTSAGTPVELGTCDGGAYQRWQLNPDGTITDANSGLCLDVTGAFAANGTAVELWWCNGGANQQWALH